MIRIPSALSAGALAAAMALAPAAMAHDVKPELGDPISLRMNAMMQTGAAIGAMAAIAKGEAEFEPRVAVLALRTMHGVALGYGEMFPEGSETGNQTKAAPAIWSDRAGFDAEVAKFIEVTGAAVAAPPQDLNGLRAALGQVGASCQSCHEGYQLSN